MYRYVQYVVPPSPHTHTNREHVRTDLLTRAGGWWGRVNKKNMCPWVHLQEKFLFNELHQCEYCYGLMCDDDISDEAIFKDMNVTYCLDCGVNLATNARRERGIYTPTSEDD